MSKLLGATAALTVAALAIAIGSLIVNIIILGKVGDGSTASSSNSATTSLPGSNPTLAPGATSTPGTPGTAPPGPPQPGCQAPGKVSTKPEFLLAAQQLLRGIDPTFDPCTDLYNFACSKYLQDGNRGTYAEGQLMVGKIVTDYLDALDPTQAPLTEQISKAAYDTCVADAQLDNSDPAIILQKMQNVQTDLNNIFGFPFLGDGPSSVITLEDFFTKLGAMERQFAENSLFSSLVSVDYFVPERNALSLSPPPLPSALDYYTLPQFIANLDDERDDIADIVKQYRDVLGLAPTLTDDDFRQFAETVVDFERRIAMSTWPDTELRNYKQQYTAYRVDQLITTFPNLRLSEYVHKLVEGDFVTTFDFNVIITEPTYFFWLDTLFANGEGSIEQLLNYAAVQYLYDNADYLPLTDRMRQRMAAKPWKSYTERRAGRIRKTRLPLVNNQRHVRDDLDSIKFGCIYDQINMMQYAPGFIYTKLREDKWDVRRDVVTQTENIISAFGEQIDSLPWMLDETKARAHDKSTSLIRNYLWPEYLYGNFRNTATLDTYHQDYANITATTDYWQVSKLLKYGMVTQEFFRNLNQPGNRYNFLGSPALVNAWYQPELNSITFPLAILNPPYYNVGWPQAYNYAGQGGTGGHELTHGYDDEGVQFGPTGGLVRCNYSTCGILDGESRKGFVDMAQCVVTQFNTQCCPVKTGNVRCVNGATTQGENIADLGGQLAAYRAYRKWVADQGQEEDLLPGLEQYTLNQIFWISYAFTWCDATTDASLVRQLLIDPHAPSVCRVNQVMQDIPEFGHDFNCKRGSPLFPQDDDRCKVWIGY